MNMDNFDRSDYIEFIVTTGKIIVHDGFETAEFINFKRKVDTEYWEVFHGGNEQNYCQHCIRLKFCSRSTITKCSTISTNVLVKILESFNSAGYQVNGVRPVLFSMKLISTGRLGEIKSEPPIPPIKRWMSHANGVLVAAKQFYFPDSFETII